MYYVRNVQCCTVGVVHRFLLHDLCWANIASRCICSSFSHSFLAGVWRSDGKLYLDTELCPSLFRALATIASLSDRPVSLFAYILQCEGADRGSLWSTQPTTRACLLLVVVAYRLSSTWYVRDDVTQRGPATFGGEGLLQTRDLANVNLGQRVPAAREGFEARTIRVHLECST